MRTTKGFMTVCILLVLTISGEMRAHAQDLTKMATDLAGRIHAMKHERVTVVDFLDLDKKPNKLGKFLAHQLQSALSEPEHNLVVVDQNHLSDLFDQMEKLSEGLIDPATARQLGKISGTEVVIYGTVMVSSLSVRVDVNAIDLQTAKVIASGSASPTRIGLLDRLAKEADREEGDVASEEEESATPVKAASSKKTPSRIRRDQGFVFELGRCSLSGDNVTCAVTVTSEGRDRLLGISVRSRAWNDAGEEYPAGEVMIANSRDDGCLIKQMLRDVPTSVAVTFPHFGGDGLAVERLRLAWTQNEYCHDLKSADFDKIALSEDADFSSPKKAGSGMGSAGKTLGSKKGGGGILGRLTEKVLETAASTVERVIDKKAKELSGEDEEPPQE